QYFNEHGAAALAVSFNNIICGQPAFIHKPNWFWDFAIKSSLFKTCPPYETLGGGEDLGEF
ncbi:MAG: hypothetical protein PVH88_27180, partial [Ignavibacteria bacterium]